MLRYFIIIILILNCLIISGQAKDHKGIWVVRHALHSKSNIEEIIQTAAELHISDIYIQVRALGQAFYPSRYGALADIPPYKKSSLQNLITLAHKKNIKIHAWLNILYVWSSTKNPPNMQHVFNKDSKAILRTANLSSRPELAQIRSENIEGFYLDPDAAENFQIIKLQIKELIDEYHVDGIHLDYFRYPGLKYSFSPLNRSKFKKMFFVDPQIAYNDPEQFISLRGYSAFKYIDDSYKDFLRNNLTGFLGNIRNYVHTINKKTILSIAVKPNPQQAKELYFQDWKDWLDHDLCDRVLLMNYNPASNTFIENINLAKKMNKTNQIVIGISTYNQESEAVLKRVNYVQKQNLAGFALFSYNYLNKNQQMLSQILSNINFLD